MAKSSPFLRGTLLLALVFALSLASLLIGVKPISPVTIVRGFWGHGNALDMLIILDLRLPRTLLCLLIGGGLGGAGAALQAFCRNPLAGPGILGFSAFAALGAVISLYFGRPDWAPATAIVTALAGATLLLGLAGRQTQVMALILAGVALGALANACTALVMNLAPNPWALSEIATWLLGSVEDASWREVRLAAPSIVIGLGLLAVTRKSLDALTLGEDTARSLGAPLRRDRLCLLFGVAGAVAGGVAVAGAVGFVGLIVPHLLRPVFGPSPSKLFLPSIAGGAGLTLLADMAARWLSGPGTPLYLGVMTALVGAPFFLHLIYVHRRTQA